MKKYLILSLAFAFALTTKAQIFFQKILLKSAE